MLNQAICSCVRSIIAMEEAPGHKGPFGEAKCTWTLYIYIFIECWTTL